LGSFDGEFAFHLRKRCHHVEEEPAGRGGGCCRRAAL
jgi:hypothetical protein